MITNPPFNEAFFSKLNTVRAGDAALDAACVKVVKKLEAYALARGISPDELRLFDVCDADGEMHPKLRLYIDRIPKLEKQSDARYEKYKEEIRANVQRAINVVVAATVVGRQQGSSCGGDSEVPALLRHDHPVLRELYDLLPRQVVASKGKVGFQRGKKLTETGCLFYLSCAEALKHCSASALHEFLSEHRHILSESIVVVCVSSPEKINAVASIIDSVCKKAGVKRKPKRGRRPVEEWPSPLREEMYTLRATADGSLIEGLEENLAQFDLDFTPRDRLRPASINIAETAIELLLSRYYQGRENLSVRDILSTTKTECMEAGGKKKIVYYNPVLTPYREAEKLRSDKYKRSGYDSRSFEITVNSLLSLAAYNGIFEYHEITREAFKIKRDVESTERRKAEKKAVIKRQGLDRWIEDNWPEYERILKQGLYKRDRSRRSYNKADQNMRFVLYYCRITTMKIMGFRQRQIRDCVYGVNLVVTQNSIEFTYPAEKMKKDIPFHFKADLESCGATHGRLIQTLALFHRHAFPYVRTNLEVYQAREDARDHKARSEDQFFVGLGNSGKFKPFDPDKDQGFTNRFKRDCRRFLKHPDLQSEAAQMIHPHYLRGAAIDTQVIDNGMSMDAATRYFAASEETIQSKYKDRKSTKDATRDVMLLNAEIEDLEARKKRNRSGSNASDATKAKDVEVQELRRQLRESRDREKQAHERERQKDARIASLEQRVDQVQSTQNQHHEEVMEVLRRSGNGRRQRKGGPTKV